MKTTVRALAVGLIAWTGLTCCGTEKQKTTVAERALTSEHPMNAAESSLRLNSDLMIALLGSGSSSADISGWITNDILGLADRNAAPSRQTALDFSTELTRAMFGRPAAPEATIEVVSTAILEVLASSGASSARFHSSVDRFRAALVDMGVAPAAAKGAAKRLLMLGQEIRGPEVDAPPKKDKRARA